MGESKQDEKRYPTVSGDEFARNPSEIMRLAERTGGVYITNEEGGTPDFIWIPQDELPPSYEY